MKTKKKNLSAYKKETVKSADDMVFGIIVSEWNSEITEALYKGAFNTLIKHGAKKENIIKKNVPGSFELPLGAQFFAEHVDVDAIICLGCIIQGETRHFEFISQAVANGITKVNLEYNIPVIFGVLTTDTYEQAKERSGGKHGNKGDEAAVSAIKMISLFDEMMEYELLNIDKYGADDLYSVDDDL